MLKKTIMLTSLILGMNMAMSATILTEGEQTEMVAAHNTWRAEVGAPKLKWSDKLGDSAQAWAETLKKDKACKMVHSHVAGIGENLFWASPLTYSSGKVEVQAISPTKTTASWGSEKKDYTYATNTCAAGKVCGHYTQVVWNKSTEVGCGKAICADKSQVWACQYTPAGNYVGQKPY
jgi:pathogenesis-related protein 1